MTTMTRLKKVTGDPEKAKSAETFYAKWKEAEANKKHKSMQKD
jgi:hypothetical protein